MNKNFSIKTHKLRRKNQKMWLWTSFGPFSISHFVQTNLLTRCWLIVGLLAAGGDDCFSTFSSGEKLGSSSRLPFSSLLFLVLFILCSRISFGMHSFAVRVPIKSFLYFVPLLTFKAGTFLRLLFIFGVFFWRRQEAGGGRAPGAVNGAGLAIMYKHYTYCMNLQRNRRLLFELQRRCDSKRLLGLRGNGRFTLYQFTSKRDQFYKHGRVCPHVLE